MQPPVQNGFGTSFTEVLINNSLCKIKEYEGEWKDGMRHGHGIQFSVLPDGTLFRKVEGIWMNGKKHRVIEYNDSNQLIYYGEYNEDEQRSEGTEYQNGLRVYKGTYQQGEYFKGKMYKNCNLIMVGEWKQGKFIEGLLREIQFQKGGCFQTWHRVTNSEVTAKNQFMKIKYPNGDKFFFWFGFSLWRGVYRQGPHVIVGYFKLHKDTQLIPVGSQRVETNGKVSFLMSTGLQHLRIRAINDMNAEELLIVLDTLITIPASPSETASIRKGLKDLIHMVKRDNMEYVIFLHGT